MSSLNQPPKRIDGTDSVINRTGHRYLPVVQEPGGGFHSDVRTERRHVQQVQERPTFPHRFSVWVGGPDMDRLYVEPGCVVYYHIPRGPNPAESDPYEGPPAFFTPVFPVLDGVPLSQLDSNNNPPFFNISGGGSKGLWLVCRKNDCLNTIVPDSDSGIERVLLLPKGTEPEIEEYENAVLITEFDLQTFGDGSVGLRNEKRRWGSDWIQSFNCWGDGDDGSSSDPSSSDPEPPDSSSSDLPPPDSSSSMSDPDPPSASSDSSESDSPEPGDCCPVVSITNITIDPECHRNPFDSPYPVVIHADVTIGSRECDACTNNFFVRIGALFQVTASSIMGYGETRTFTLAVPISFPCEDITINAIVEPIGTLPGCSLDPLQNCGTSAIVPGPCYCDTFVPPDDSSSSSSSSSSSDSPDTSVPPGGSSSPTGGSSSPTGGSSSITYLPEESSSCDPVGCVRITYIPPSSVGIEFECALETPAGPNGEPGFKFADGWSLYQNGVGGWSIWDGTNIVGVFNDIREDCNPEIDPIELSNEYFIIVESIDCP